MLLAITENNDAIIAVCVSFFMFGMPVIGWIVWRSYAHRERMAMIQQGMYPNGRGVRRAGPPPGSQGPVPGAPFTQQTYFIPNDEAQCLLRKGITTAFVGLALLIGLSFIGYHGDSFVPGPWLLGGLIPLFVGLAQIVSALAGGATFGNARWPSPPSGMPPSPPPQAPEPPIYGVPDPSQPYAYRPPGDQQELPRSNPPRRP